jgi:hypothetical protein
MRIEKQIGKYSEKEARKYLKKGLPFLGAWAFLFVTGLDYLPIYINLGKAAPASNFLAGIVFTYGLLQFFVPYQNWKSGLNGERRVVSNLSDKLSNEFSIYNDVLLKYGQRSGNIDHVVIGPTGIFVIETKNNQGSITYDGYGWKGIGGNRNPSSQVNKNMFRIKDILKTCELFKVKELYLKQIVLFSNPKAIIKKTKDPDYGCKIIQIKSIADTILADFIMNNRVCFSDQEIREIEQCLESNIGNYN